MERLTRNIYITCGLFAAVGVAYLMGRGEPPPAKTEKEMIALLPVKVANMPYDKNSEDPDVSYKMDETTYKVLRPFGIVAREYWKGARRFDVVVIASRSKDSFHDPRVCFSAQGWTIEQFFDQTVRTKNRGIVPVRIISISKEKSDSSFAVFLYKAPNGKFYSNTLKFKLGLWTGRFEDLLTGKIKEEASSLDGVFYRFMPKYPNASIDELKWFVSQYLDEAYKSSNGYF